MALVSTNSVTQREAVSILWKPLFQDGINIDFADRTFKWDSEAKIKAHLYCVIIGFSKAASDKPKTLLTGDRGQVVKNINGYIIDGEKALFIYLGILESNIHMSWMRAVCGKLKSDYSYSKDIDYNNFPWSTPTNSQR